VLYSVILGFWNWRWLCYVNNDVNDTLIWDENNNWLYIFPFASWDEMTVTPRLQIQMCVVRVVTGKLGSGFWIRIWGDTYGRVRELAVRAFSALEGAPYSVAPIKVVHSNLDPLTLLSFAWTVIIIIFFFKFFARTSSSKRNLGWK
jgi:hypothetical protein